MLPPPWPHQDYAPREVLRLISEGYQRICLTSPTGGGKTRIISDIVHIALSMNWGACVYANRRFIVEQLIENLYSMGHEFGVRAAESWDLEDDLIVRPLQICSIQTEYSRVFKHQSRELHNAKIIVIDEAHLNNNRQANTLSDAHLDRGAYLVGVTATPLGLQDRYDKLVVAGNNSQLRDCGALVMATHYGCDEPDQRLIAKVKVGEELTEGEQRKAIMVPGIFGRVLDWYRRLNPTGLPSLGFAPGVRESIGFAEAFDEAGIPAGHVDADEIRICGKRYPANKDNRKALLRASESGEIRIIWCRYVLREAVDMRWISHGIFACVFGTIQSYLQSGGRLLRSCPERGKTGCIIQDHGGNWWRHGSLNADRHWELSMTAHQIATEREDAMTGYQPPGDPPPPEPFLCPGCHRVLVLKNVLTMGVGSCPSCGHDFNFVKRARPVIQHDGVLLQHYGTPFAKRRVEERDNTQSLWNQYYWRALNSRNKMTFNQAAGLFYLDNGYYPPRHLKLMPKKAMHWYLSVAKVDRRELL